MEHALTVAGAQRDEEGRFVVTGEAPAVGFDGTWWCLTAQSTSLRVGPPRWRP